MIALLKKLNPKVTFLVYIIQALGFLILLSWISEFNMLTSLQIYVFLHV